MTASPAANGVDTSPMFAPFFEHPREVLIGAAVASPLWSYFAGTALLASTVWWMSRLAPLETADTELFEMFGVTGSEH